MEAERDRTAVKMEPPAERVRVAERVRDEMEAESEWLGRRVL
jgi:hypothetical protein